MKEKATQICLSENILCFECNGCSCSCSTGCSGTSTTRSCKMIKRGWGTSGNLGRRSRGASVNVCRCIGQCDNDVYLNNQHNNNKNTRQNENYLPDRFGKKTLLFAGIFLPENKSVCHKRGSMSLLTHLIYQKEFRHCQHVKLVKKSRWTHHVKTFYTHPCELAPWDFG